jgi:hypothetical protein
MSGTAENITRACPAGQVVGGPGSEGAERGRAVGSARGAGVESVGGFTPLLPGELACTLLFGVSWIVKGFDIARELTTPGEHPNAEPAARDAVRSEPPLSVASRGSG